MPTYLYECEMHGEFEAMHSISEQLTVCPKCKENGLTNKSLKRLIASGSTFILQGGGWAKDNYSK